MNSHDDIMGMIATEAAEEIHKSMPKPHNPDGLTDEQVGVADGWRLLDTDELFLYWPMIAGIEMWSRNGSYWYNGGAVELSTSYRTRLSRPDLRAARGLPPEKELVAPPITVAQLDKAMELQEQYRQDPTRYKTGLPIEPVSPTPEMQQAADQAFREEYGFGRTQTAEELAKEAAKQIKAGLMKMPGLEVFEHVESFILTAIQTATANAQKQVAKLTRELANATEEVDRRVAHDKKALEAFAVVQKSTQQSAHDHARNSVKWEIKAQEAKKELETTKRELAMAKEACKFLAAKDRPIPEDVQILKSHPMECDNCTTYDDAIRMVSAKHSKYGLVNLVNWMLSDLAETKARLEQANMAIEREWPKRLISDLQSQRDEAKSQLDDEKAERGALDRLLNNTNEQLEQMRKERDEVKETRLKVATERNQLQEARDKFSDAGLKVLSSMNRIEKERDTALAKLREVEATCVVFRKLLENWAENCPGIAYGGAGLPYGETNKALEAADPGQSLLSELDQLRKLKTYAHHGPQCAVEKPPPGVTCVCGLSALLEDKA